MKQKLLFLLALAFVSISAMGQVTFTAIGGSDFDDGEGSKMACDGNINTKWCKRGNDDVDKLLLGGEGQRGHLHRRLQHDHGQRQ